jgi:hypothetical protein
VFKVCLRIGQVICGGGPDKDYTGLMVNDFIRLNKMDPGSADIRKKDRRIEQNEK